MTGKSFVHLHVHSEYSMLDGAARVREMVKEAARLGMPALAVTDHGVLYGLIDFYQACHDEGVKPILGCELYLARDSRFMKSAGDDSPKTIMHLTVLAKDERGYRNLLQLATTASLEGYYYKPRVDMDLLAEHADGLIATTGCLNGKIPRLLLEGQVERAWKEAGVWQDIFGQDSFFIELQDHGIADQHKVNPHLVEMSAKLGIPMIGTNDLHYTSRSDAEAHDILLCIQTGATADEPNRFKFDAQEFYLKSRQEMEAVLGHYPDALDRTLDVAEMCDVRLQFGELQLPDFRPPEGSSLGDYLVALTYQGARQRYGDPVPPEVRERLDYELNVILEMGFPGYFLIVADLVNWAKGRGIRVGPGRGSAAGSCVSYCLGIVELDPIRYNLMFERFLNPARREMPDIDIDFDERYRDVVIGYLREKYGEDKVAQIVTFATIKGKSAIRDAARVLGFPYGFGDRLAKMYPRPMLGKDPSLRYCLERPDDPKWAYAYTEGAELRKAFEDEPESRRVLEAAVKLEGLRRQTGVHAAAVVISREPLVNHTALQRTDNGVVVTQYEMNAIGKLGLLKMDILGLSNLTIIDLTLDLLRRRDVDLDIDNVLLDDPKVYEMLQRGDSDGVFQMESEGVRRLLVSLRPDRLEDIIALIALYRPGPMDQIPHYIEGKHHPERVRYPVPVLEPVLKDTYGVIVYQEQILQLLQTVAGYSAAEADLVRKAIGKKVEKMMKAEEPKFIEGARQGGVSEEQARHLWELIQPFAGYSFNRAHAACYGFVAYQTAYLKAHYPVEYLCALLTNMGDSTDDKTKYLAVARKMGITVLPPDVNRSDARFAPDPEEPSAVRYGLGGVRNVGEGVCEQILAARREGGPFADFFDFCRRVDVSVLNKRVVESLIKAGAFDSMGHSRGGLLGEIEAGEKRVAWFERIVETIAAQRRREREGQFSLFGGSDDSANGSGGLVGASMIVPDVRMPKQMLMAFEKEMLGQWVTDHPLYGLEQTLACQTTASIGALSERQEGAVVTVGGIITKIGKKFTRKGELMLLVQLEDLEASCEVVVFPAVAERAGHLVELDRVVCVKGRVDHKDDNPKVAAMEVVAPDLEILDAPLRIFLPAGRVDARLVAEIKGILADHPGKTPVFIHLQSDGGTKVLRLPADLRVDATNGCVDLLRLKLGAEAVKAPPAAAMAN